MIPRRVVVGVALVRAGRVLAARRTDPPGWEFPGGKVEAGETSEQAAVREVREELGCRIEVIGWLDGMVEIAPRLDLVVCLARLSDPAEDPVAAEHAELRWLSLPEQLDAVRWLPADRAFVEPLRSWAARTR